MFDTPNPLEELLKIEETHGKLMGLTRYVLRECGGLVWPFLYTFLLYCGWNALSGVLRSVFVLLGFILTSIAILYPYAWKKHYEKLYRDYKIMVEKPARIVLELIKRDDIGTYYVWTKQIQDLTNSLRDFESKYFLKKENAQKGENGSEPKSEE
jgi:hypothetical protein